MEKRVFLAIFLSFAVLAVYQLIWPTPPPGQTLQQPAASPAAGTTAAPATPPAPAGTKPDPAATVENAGVPQGPTAVIADASAREIVVETDWIRAVFSSAGATLRSWQL